MEDDHPLKQEQTIQSGSAHSDVQGALNNSSTDDSSNWHASAALLGSSFLDSIAFNGVSANLVVYIYSVLYRNNAESASSVAAWRGTCYLATLVVALIGDTYCSNFTTILFSLVAYLFGMITITFSTYSATAKFHLCNDPSCQSGSAEAFFIGLYMVALANGGIKAALLSFGGEQFFDDKVGYQERKQAFLRRFNHAITLGTLISSTFIVWTQENIGWCLGYGIATISVATALVVFVIGTPYYQLIIPSGSPLKRISQIVLALFKNRPAEIHSKDRLFYEVDGISSKDKQSWEHEKEYRCLDKSATVCALDFKCGSPQNSWKLHIVTVEEMKAILRLLPIWSTSVVYAAAFSQNFTTFIQQGSTMNNKLGSFSVPPASLCSFEIMFATGWVFASNSLIAPRARKYLANGTGLSQLQWMGIGHILMVLAMVTAAYNERRRLKIVNYDGENISIAWQMPQYFLFAISEVFHNNTQLEFYSSQVSDRWKSICSALFFSSMALGCYLNSLIITIIHVLTSRGEGAGWIPDDLNKGHLDYHYFLLAGISTVNFFAYLIFARKMTVKKEMPET